MKIHRWLAVGVAAAILNGCGGASERPTSGLPMSASESISQTTDGSNQGGNNEPSAPAVIEGQALGAAVKELQCDNSVRSLEDVCRALGYRISLDNAVQFANLSTAVDAPATKVTFIPYSHPTDPAEAVYIVAVEQAGARHSGPVVLRTAAPREDDPRQFDYLEEALIWIGADISADQGLARRGARLSDVDSPEMDWSWKKFLKCWAKGTVSTCAGAAVGCAITGGGWAHCAVAWCTAGTIASGVGCAADQMF